MGDQEEGKEEKENNRLLTVELNKAKKEVAQLKEIVGKQVENSKVDTEVVKRVEEYKREVREEKEDELKKLKQENMELMMELGGKNKELELMTEQRRKVSKNRRGAKRKKKGGEGQEEEDIEEKEGEKVSRQVDHRGKVGVDSSLTITARRM